jgi:hypothetical protein
MRKLVALTTATAALGAGVVATTSAQEQLPETKVTVDAKVTPNKAGTKKNPQGVRLNVNVKWESQEGFERPVITAATVFFPKGSLYNGGKYAKCSFRVADRPGGPRSCPPKSIMGSARASAWADDVITRPKVTIINGGARAVCLHTVLNNPARVERCVRGTVTKINHPKWQYRLRLIVPEDLQFVAGTPIALRDFKSVAGGKSYAKDWLATTSCPRSRRWEFEVETEYLYEDGSRNSSKYADSIACRR